MRALPYAIQDVRSSIAKALQRPETEMAVHGIDAWRDSTAGRAELQELTAVTGEEHAGVRMHWLYFSADSARHLEAAGFDYDSTCGYNEAVGYRAVSGRHLTGLRPAGCERLLELPMSIMDTALFYGGRMGLDRREALRRCRALVKNARNFGGTLTVNWHDRSLAPERQWGRAYRELLHEIMETSRVWFATASQAVGWFRWRRSVRFERDADSNHVLVKRRPAPTAFPARLWSFAGRPARPRCSRSSRSGGACRVRL